MIRLPSGSVDLADRAARGRRALGDLDLDDLELLVAQVEQVHEPVGRDLVLDQAQDQVGRARRPAGCRAARSTGGCAGC